MRILVLGGGSGQLSIIKKIKKLKHQVVLSDYLSDAPGRKFADFSEKVSTFDVEANIKTAEKYNVDAVLTAGTDQPVYTAAAVSEALDLPSFLDKKTALAVTNKKFMKNIFSQNNIPAVKYKLLAKNFSESDFSGLKAPYVIKPLDSQGQRGVFKLNTASEVRENYQEVLSYSRQQEFLLEEYYPGDEITLSGWVNKGRLKILSITDRVTYQNKKHIGISSAHIFPSKYLAKHYKKIKKISDDIVKAFAIKEGPVYFQMLAAKDGIKVNEIACRIGGAYEGYYLPKITGVDIEKMLIDISLGREADSSNLKSYDIEDNKSWLSVQLFYADKGRIKYITPKEQILALKGVLKTAYNFRSGDIIAEIENATQRAGYFIVKAESRKQLKSRIKKVYDKLEFLSQNNENLIIREIGEVL